MKIRRGFRFVPAIICMAAIFWFSSRPAIEVDQAVNPLFQWLPSISLLGSSVPINWYKVGHVVGYSTLGAALLYGFGAMNRPAVTRSLGATMLYAVFDEIHQGFTPGRSPSFGDVVLDTDAAALTILLILLITRVIQSARLSRARV